MQQSRFTRCAYPLNRGLAAHALMLAGCQLRATPALARSPAGGLGIVTNVA